MRAHYTSSRHWPFQVLGMAWTHDGWVFGSRDDRWRARRYEATVYVWREVPPKRLAPARITGKLTMARIGRSYCARKMDEL